MKQIAVTVALIIAVLAAIVLTAWANSVYMAGLLCVLGVLSIVWAAMQAEWGRAQSLFRLISKD